ncbi:hypothetical protein COUCH_06280 [Couchioplanes caeruleus]|uniref:hypothetical protein n=1 Tax=Couchioplanes caeruleus TaxID=56438 RepID=UPI0020C176DD|nr:hypothetical protein [Couchioplanes caeruleus]UQU65913.1 hypothetical protein COUCH_06280 [Couchioplanes caeruleus]
MLVALLLAALTTLAAPPALAATPAPSADAGAVKYYVVRNQFNGEPEFLFEIAQRFLGSGDRNDEIFALNRGRLQPDGLRLTKPESILPGWILQLPADAEGVGVQTGPLPAVTVPEPVPAQALTPAAGGPAWWIWALVASAAVVLLAGAAAAWWWLARHRRMAAAPRTPAPLWPDTDRYYRLEDSGG